MSIPNIISLGPIPVPSVPSIPALISSPTLSYHLNHSPLPTPRLILYLLLSHSFLHLDFYPIFLPLNPPLFCPPPHPSPTNQFPPQPCATCPCRPFHVYIYRQCPLLTLTLYISVILILCQSLALCLSLSLLLHARVLPFMTCSLSPAD